MKIDKTVILITICFFAFPVLVTGQDYSELWLINHSSYQVRVLIDGWEQGSVWTGATSRMTVLVGYHEVYAEEYQSGDVYWGPYDIYVPEEGYELTLYDPDPMEEESYTTDISNLYVINYSGYDARIFVDGWEKGTAVAGGTFTTTLQGGYDYEFYAEDRSGEIYWGPEVFYVPEGEDFTWTLEY
jgi:hypothetical protein